MKYFILCLLIISPLALADALQIHEKTITNVHVYSNGASFNYTPAIVEDYCPGGGNGRFDTVHISWATDADMKAMYSAALTAFVSGKTVGFGVVDCIAGNGGVIPKAYRLDMHSVGVSPDEIIE